MLGNIRRYYSSGHTIQRKTLVRGDRTSPQEQWVDHLYIQGHKWDLGGGEKLAAGKTTYTMNARLVTGFADIREDDRYIDPDGQIYDVRFVATRLTPGGQGHLEIDLELTR